MAQDQAPSQPVEWQQPGEEEIRQQAYELYRQRELEFGGPLDDWLEAEAELLLRRVNFKPLF